MLSTFGFTDFSGIFLFLSSVLKNWLMLVVSFVSFDLQYLLHLLNEYIEIKQASTF